MSKSVRDLMHIGVITCRPDANLGQLAVLLIQNRIHALVVTSADGRALGIITDFDLLAGEWLSTDPEKLETMQSMTAGDLMSTPVDTVEADAPVINAARRMLKESIHRLLVTEKQKPVGIISILDYISDLADRVPHQRKTVADVMTSAILICRDRTEVKTAARAMVNTGLRSIIVVDAKGHPLGAVNGMDLLGFYGKRPDADQTVADLMHAPLTINRIAGLREAANMMIEHHHHRLIVVNPDEPGSVPMGIISSSDIIAGMAESGSVWQP